ncbi:MAG: FAD-dependent oxidoreductase [Candidatus Pacebacteria bacterium]|nr:FAD-dependent oxidoreductase [Candidatus Paceibacterota bacterium]
MTDKLQPGQKYVTEVQAEVLSPVDVVVAGGGTAGVTAALAAARAGARTILVEASGSLGGMMTRGNAGLTMYMKFSGQPREHAKDLQILKDEPEEVQIAGGLAKEITDRLIQAGSAVGTYDRAGKYVFTNVADFKRLLLTMMDEANVGLRLHSLLVDVIQEDGQVVGVALESKSGRQIIPARQFIDATGDGDLAVRADAPYTVGVTADDICAAAAKTGEMMAMGVIFKLGNVDLHRTFAWFKEHPEHFDKQLFARYSLEEAESEFASGAMSTFVIRGQAVPWMQVYNSPNPGEVMICCPSVTGDGINVESLTRAEVTMGAMLERWMKSLWATPGFEQAYLQDQPEMGVRETRHIQGDYILNIEDIFNQRQFTDCIGFGAHPIDTTPRPEWLDDPETAYPRRWFFQIPFCCLTVKGIPNLLTAGRCISATHEAFGCIRPTVQCMITGEAAGAAAALAIGNNVNPRDLDTRLLREHLQNQGSLC